MRFRAIISTTLRIGHQEGPEDAQEGRGDAQEGPEGHIDDGDGSSISLMGVDGSSTNPSARSRAR